MSASNNEKKIKKYHEYVFNIQNDFSVSLYDAEKIVETLICTNTISTIEDVMKFYNNQRDRNSAVIKQKPISELEQWNISDQTISHSSKNFFEVIGISTRESSSREVGKKGWDQPILREKNDVGGLLGLIRTYINDMPHYLVDAKFEPGNFHDIQFSPTLQATFSNIEMAHGGSSPNYIEFFKDYKNKENYIFNNWLSEDGGRLYKKRNLGLIKSIDFEQIGPLKSSFIYLSRHQILSLSKNETIINPHLMRLINF